MSLILRLGQLEAKGSPVAVCTIIKSTGITPRHVGSKMLVTMEGRVEGTIGGGEAEKIVVEYALSAIRSKKPQRVLYKYTGNEGEGIDNTVGEIDVFIDPILPKLTIVVVGGGHVGKQVVFLAKWLGYHVILTDDRPDFCNASTCPGADDYICCPLADIEQKIIITRDTYFVLTTRNADVDIEGLPSILRSETLYIGVIGSEKRKISLFEGLFNKGIENSVLSKIHSPIGLRIYSETPEEIAISILAEILQEVQKNLNIDS